jgi:phage shock protein A
MRQQRMFRDQLAALGEKARFAMAENREDLAEAAVSRQLDFEAQAERLNKVEADAASEAARLDECLSALNTRKQQMEEALAAFETAQREASFGGEGPVRPDRQTERRVDKAEQAFDRAMAGAGGVAGFTRGDAQTVQKVAELATLQKSAAIAERMAALRSAQKAS